jgi:hypothetical protein
MSQKLTDLFNEKNALILKGEMMEANEEFYASNAKTIDFNGMIANGKEEHKQTRKNFLSTIAKVNQIKLLKTAVGEDVTFAEFIFDFDMKDGSTIYWHEIIKSQWKDGLVVEEQYFKG